MAVESNDTAVTENVKSNTVEGSNAVTINIRCSNGTKFSVQATLDSSVESFKSVVEQHCDIPAGQQKMIYKGLILKDDETLQSYGMEPEHTVYLVSGFVTTPAAAAAGGAPTTTTTTSTPPVAAGGMWVGRGRGVEELYSYRDLESMIRNILALPRDILALPEFENSLDDPERMREMMMEVPYMRDAIESNPMHVRMINDPVTFGRIMEAARRPTFFEQMMMRNRAVTDADPTTGSPAPNANPLPNPWAAAAAALSGQANRINAAVDETGRPVVSYIFGVGLPDDTTPDDSSMSELMQNPAVLQMMQALLSNPQHANEILGSNPEMQSILKSNPQFKNRFQNPDFIHELTSTYPEALQQMMQGLLSNPQHLNEILGSNPQMQSILDSNPQLREMMQNPDFIRQLTSTSPETMQQSVLSGLGQQEPTQDLGQTGGATVPPEEFYATQLTQLQEMGFSDTMKNLQALAATGGNVQAAVERLLGNLGQ